MITDVSTRIWNDTTEIGIQPGGVPTPWKAIWPTLSATGESHDEATSCVDLAFVSSFRSEFLGAHLPAERIASFVGKAPNRRIGFAGIDPMHRDAMLDVDQAVKLGLSGVTISPAAQNYHPTNSRAMRLYEFCERVGLPILIEYGIHLSLPSVTLEYARPTALDEVARSFPNLKMVIGQFGFPWVDETVLMIGKYNNLYTDTSGIVAKPWTLYNTLMKAFEGGVLEKVLFGSGFPFESPEQAIKRIYTINTYSIGSELPSIPRSQLRGIVERDALDCLGLQRPEGASIGRGIGRVFDSHTTEDSLSEHYGSPASSTDEDWNAHHPFDTSQRSTESHY